MYCVIFFQAEQTGSSDVFKAESPHNLAEDQIHQTHSSLPGLHSATLLWPFIDADGTRAFLVKWFVLLREKSLEVRAAEEPEDDVAGKMVNLKSQTSCCYTIINHLFYTPDLRQRLPGKFTEVLFDKTEQLIIQKYTGFCTGSEKPFISCP